MTISRAMFEKPLVEIVDAACDRFSEQVCLQFGEEVFTYGQVKALSIEIAEALQGSGFKQGMHGAIYSLNSAISFVVALGIIRAGGVWLPVNPRNSVADNLKILNKLGCNAIFYQQAFEDTVGEIDQSRTALVVAQSILELDDWLRVSPRQAVVRNDSLSNTITMPTTGGTTGEPKAVMLSERNMRALSYAMSHYMSISDPREEIVLLCAAPMTHVGGRIVLTSMATGCRFVILDKVDPQEILTAIEREKVTDFFLPPTAIYALLAQPNVRDIDYSSLRSLAYGSAPISLDKLKEALDVFGPVMTGGFGQTECPMMITKLLHSEHFVDGQLAPDARLRSVGRASVISEVAILDDDANPLPQGELGEIGVKGDMVCEGYFNDPDETARMRKNGWHLTGDIGVMDKAGYVCIVDRKKDMIVTGGFNVYSSEVEQALALIDGVDMAVVIGVPSEYWGEEVKALICRASGSDISEQEIIAKCKTDIGGVKTPKSIEFVTDFPKTPLGKIDKKALKNQYR